MDHHNRPPWAGHKPWEQAAGAPVQVARGSGQAYPRCRRQQPGRDDK